MRSFVVGACAALLLFVSSSSVPSPKLGSAATRTGNPIRLDDLTLDRLVRLPVTLSYVSGGGGITGATFTLPPNVGFVMESFYLPQYPLPPSNPIQYQTTYTLNGLFLGNNLNVPQARPLILRPGDALTVTANPPNNSGDVGGMFVGWLVYPGEV